MFYPLASSFFRLAYGSSLQYATQINSLPKTRELGARAEQLSSSYFLSPSNACSQRGVTQRAVPVSCCLFRPRQIIRSIRHKYALTSLFALYPCVNQLQSWSKLKSTAMHTFLRPRRSLTGLNVSCPRVASLTLHSRHHRPSQIRQRDYTPRARQGPPRSREHQRLLLPHQLRYHSGRSG